MSTSPAVTRFFFDTDVSEAEQKTTKIHTYIPACIPNKKVTELYVSFLGLRGELHDVIWAGVEFLRDVPEK